MAIWIKEDNHDKVIKYLLFLIWPLVSLLYSFRRIKTKSSYTIFFLFALLFGLSFTVQSGKTENSTFDGQAYRAQFDQYKITSYSDYLNGLKEFFSFKGGKGDYYFDSVAFYVSRLTGNYHVLFLVFAFVFAFFALKSFEFLTSENNFNVSLSCFILAYLFMINQIFNINGVRFNTAAWIGVYCMFQIFRKGDKRYFLLALCTPFVHSAFWIFIAIIFIAYFLKRFERFWVVLFFASFFVSSIAMAVITDISHFLPVVLQELIASYTNPWNVKLANEAGTGFSWMARLFDFLVRFYLNFMVFLFIKNSKMVKGNPKTKSLYLFILVWMTFVNFTMPVPSLGVRFMMMAFPVVAYIWLVNFKGVKYQKVLYMMPFVFFMVIRSQVLNYLAVLQPVFYVSSPFYLIYKYLIL